MVIRNFAALEAALAGLPPLRPAVAGADDPETLAALEYAFAAGWVDGAVLTGDVERIASVLSPALAARTILRAAATATDAAATAVAAIRNGDANVLVKGGVDSAAYLRAVVARDTGLRASPVLSNITIAEMPSVPRLIGATDNGIVVQPTLAQKRAILRNAVPLFRGLGATPLRVAAIAASEKVHDAQIATKDAAVLRDEAAAGDGTLLVDGPFGYDVALSPAAAARKGFASSTVAGQADLILFPAIEAGNATVKSWKLHGQARTASIVMGACVPILLNSRSDGAESRRLGLLLAGAVCMGQEAT